VQARRVDEGDLGVREPGDPDNPVPGRLRPRRHDAHLLPDERIEQSGFADVRTANESSEAAAEVF